LVAAVLLIAAALLLYVRRIPAAPACYGTSVACVVITPVMHVATLIRQVRR
jgi:hypothetical protein